MIFILVPLLIALVVVQVSKGKRSGATKLPGHRLEIGWSSEAKWRVAPALARVEARKLLRHPAFVTGLVVTPLMVIAAVEGETTAFRASTSLALAMVPLGWMTIIAIDLIALRSVRSNTEELFVSLPAPGSVRTAGLLLLVPYVFAVAAAVLLVAGVTIGAFPDVVGLQAYEGDFIPLEMAAGAFIVAGSLGLGVAVARWLPHARWGVVAMFATILLQARFLDTNTWPWNSTESDLRRLLGFLVEPTAATAALEVRRPGWHLVYLVGLIGLISIVALSKHGWSRFVGGGLAGALVVVAVAGVVQTRPPTSGQVDAMVARLETPMPADACRTRDAVVYCAFDTTSPERVDEWQARVDAVLAVLPVDPARRQLEVRQRHSAVVGNRHCLPVHLLEVLPREVSARVAPERVWPADGHVHPSTKPDSFGCDESATGSLFVALQTGAWAVGLPPAPHDDDVRCAADGQARSVLALWLGVQATPDGDALVRRTIAEGSDGSHLTFPEWDERPVLGVTYAVSDVLTALDILAKPRDQVTVAVRENWEQLTASDAPAAAFADLVGVSAHAVDDRASGGAPCT